MKQNQPSPGFAGLDSVQNKAHHDIAYIILTPEAGEG
jgi:hypothetical protein